MRGSGSPLKYNVEKHLVIKETHHETLLSTDSVEEDMIVPFSLLVTKMFTPGSIKGSTFTLICSTLGTGLLLMPNAVSQSGIAWSITQMIICAGLAYFSLVVLIKCAQHYQAYSFQHLAELTYGTWYKQFINVVFFLTCWGASIAILIMISQLVVKAIGNFDDAKLLPFWLTDPLSKFWPIIIGTVFVFPLSLARELKQLRYVCFLSFCCVLILTFVVLYESFHLDDFTANAQSTEMFIPEGVSTTFATTLFALSCHPNALDVFKELQNSNKRRMKRVLKRTFFITLLFYIVIGIFGYITFVPNLSVLGDTKRANGCILFAYGYDVSGNARRFPSLVFITLLLEGFSLIVLEPLCIKPAKDSLQNMFSPKHEESPSKLKHFILVTITVYSVVAVSIYVKNLPKLLGIIGSSLVCMVCFIIPSTFYLKMKKEQSLRGYKLFCWVLIFGSAILGTYGTVTNLIALIKA